MKRCLVRVVHAAWVAILLAACAPAWGQTTYCVATNGSDANSGADWTQPFKTITNAIRIAQSGDTILATNGTYTYSATGLPAGNGKAIKITNGITLRSVNGYAVTIIKPGSGYSDDGDGAVIMNHANAVLDGFRVTASYSGNAGGISLTTGLVQNCWIDSNNGYRGGGVALYGSKDAATAYKATVRNCMIVANIGRDGSGGGGVHWYNNYAGVVDSCTIIKNTAPGGGGVRNVTTGGTILNSIVHGNSSSGSYQDFYWTAATVAISNNCITKDYTTVGAGNITNDPSFLNWTEGDYHLSPLSPCRDKGSIQAWMAGTTDLSRVVARIMPVVNGTNDMGCFEFDTDALLCSISATPLYGFPPLPVTFTSSVSGDTNGLFYRWDIRADGSFEVEGSRQGRLHDQPGYRLVFDRIDHHERARVVGLHHEHQLRQGRPAHELRGRGGGQPGFALHDLGHGGDEHPSRAQPRRSRDVDAGDEWHLQCPDQQLHHERHGRHAAQYERLCLHDDPESGGNQ